MQTEASIKYTLYKYHPGRVIYHGYQQYKKKKKKNQQVAPLLLY